MKKQSLFLGLSCALLALSGCASTFEGSGSKEAASAEQLALRLDDPWDHAPTTVNGSMSGVYVDGTYVGIGQGMDGWIQVEVTIENNHLTVESIMQEGETQSVGGYEAIRDGVYAEKIEAAQGVDFDNVSGATITTIGVREALQSCLDQAANK